MLYKGMESSLPTTPLINEIEVLSPKDILVGEHSTSINSSSSGDNCDNFTEILSPKDMRMEKAGATREVAYKKVVDMLSAKNMTVDKYGDEHFSEDNTTQLRASEMILKMRGEIRPDVVVDNRVVNISGIPKEILTGLIDMVRDVGDQLSSLRTSGQQTGEIIDVNPG